MIGLVLASICLFTALFPAILFFWNLTEFKPLPRASAAVSATPPLSVLIPARDEASSIGPALHRILQNTGVDFEVIVLDDHSTDRTAAIVAEFAAVDPRVRLVRGEPLPPGWCGKQHACQQLGQLARHDLLIWIDADVRLLPGSLARIGAAMEGRDIGLLSGFPYQSVETFLEKLLIPLMHFLLLGYCPLWGMRHSRSPAFGAGCGQLMIARRDAYQKAGGHAAIRASLHDGITLPRAFRRAGYLTGIFDATDLAECRMYHSAGQVWRGLLKNAGEGLATPAGILPWTIILCLGQLAPPALALGLAIGPVTPFTRLALALCIFSWLSSLTIRLIAAARFRQPILAAALHPVAILLLLTIQWQAVFRRAMRMPTSWRGRPYPASG